MSETPLDPLPGVEPLSGWETSDGRRWSREQLAEANIWQQGVEFAVWCVDNLDDLDPEDSARHILKYWKVVRKPEGSPL